MCIGRKYDDGELGVAEDRASEVKKPVDSEFDAGTHDPAEGSKVVVGSEGKNEWVVRLEGRAG